MPSLPPGASATATLKGHPAGWAHQWSLMRQTAIKVSAGSTPAHN